MSATDEIKNYYLSLGIKESVYDFCEATEQALLPRFQEIDRIAEQNQIFLRICLNMYQKYSFQNSEVYTICIFFKENPPYLLTLPVKCAIIIWYTFRQCASRAMLPIRLTYKLILCGTAPAKQQQIPLCAFCRTVGFWKESILWITTKDETVLPPLTTESEPKKAGQAFRCGNITDRPVHRNIPITVLNWKKPLPSPNGSSFCGKRFLFWVPHLRRCS